MKALFGNDMGRWITVFLMLSILGILNTQVMFAPRVIYSMSRDGLFFKQAEKVNAAGSPTNATHLTIFSACLFLLAGKEINERLSDIATFFFVASYLAGFASLLRLRVTEPKLKRPYLAWGYPILPWVLVIISTLFLIGTLVTNLGSVPYVLGFIMASYVVYRTFLHKSTAS
jgi:APA family basic amino acid/polyamine antiporter